MDQLAKIISAVTEKTVRFESITEDEYAQVCREGEEPVPEFMISVLTSLYHAVENKEFEWITNHVAEITGAPPESVESYLRRVISSSIKQ